MRILIILIFLASCKSSDQISSLDSNIKWDFYKKNIHSEFSNSGQVVSFLNCDLSIAKIDQVDSLDCYYGEFRYGNKLSSNHSDTGLKVPIVHTICYDKQNDVIINYMISSAIVSIDPEKEISESKLLKKVIRERKTNNFLNKW